MCIAEFSKRIVGSKDPTKSQKGSVQRCHSISPYIILSCPENSKTKSEPVNIKSEQTKPALAFCGRIKYDVFDTVNCSLSFCYDRPSVDAMLRIAGNGLPHQPAGWFAMTTFSMVSAPISVLSATKFPCHCEPVRTLAWQSASPASAGCHRSNGTLNYNLNYNKRRATL